MAYGYLKISRKAYAEDPLWNEKRVLSRWEAWEDLMQSAAFQPYKRVTSTGVVRLERGEVLASFRYLADRWQWTVKRARTFVKWLTDDGRMRAQRETHQGTVYLLVNYDFYQSGGTPEDTPKDTPKDTPEDTLGGTPEDTPGGSTSAFGRSSVAFGRSSVDGRPNGGPNWAQREAHQGTVYLPVNYDFNQSGGTPEGTPKGTDGAHLGHTSGTPRAQIKKAVKQLSSKGSKEYRGADAPESFPHLMNVCCEVFPAENLDRCGSVLKRLLKSNDQSTIEAVIRGLPLVNEKYTSLVPLNSKEHGDDIWAEAYQRYWQSQKETRRADEADHGPQHISGLLERFTEPAT